MSTKLMTRAQRIEQLVAASALQREALAAQLQPIMHPLAHFDSGMKVVRFVREKPAVLAVVAAAILAIKPRRIKAAYHQGKHAWRTWGHFLPMVQNFMPVVQNLLALRR